MPCRSTSRARAASMAGGPQPTTLAGRSPRSSRRASRSVTNPWWPAEPSSVASSTAIPARRKSSTPGSRSAGPDAVEQGGRASRRGGRRDRRSRRRSVGHRAQPPSAQGQERRLADARRRRRRPGRPGAGRSRCPAAPRPTGVAGPAPGQGGGPPADDEIDHVDGTRRARASSAPRRRGRRAGPGAGRRRPRPRAGSSGTGRAGSTGRSSGSSSRSRYVSRAIGDVLHDRRPSAGRREAGATASRLIIAQLVLVRAASSPLALRGRPLLHHRPLAARAVRSGRAPASAADASGPGR